MIRSNGISDSRPAKSQASGVLAPAAASPVLSQAGMLAAGGAHRSAVGGRQSWRVLAILSALMGFASISTDLYLPAMPAIGATFGAGMGSVELTVSSYLIGFSLGQLFWGPIGDRHGRRLPIAVGIVLFAVGSAGCALAGSVATMIAWRIVQALGASAGVVLARAMVRDLYDGDKAARMMSTLMTVMAVAPLLGPIVGAQILHFASWRSIFGFLICVGIATLVALSALPETLRKERRIRHPISRAFSDYLQLLRHRRLMAYAGAGGFFYAGMFAYVAGTPFAYIGYYKVPPRFYGVLFGVGILGIMTTNLINARHVMRLGSARLLRMGAAGAALSGLLVALAARTGWGGLAGLALPLFLFASMAGLIVANSLAGALADFPGKAGAVSAFVGAIHYGSGIVGSAMVGAFADGTPWPLGWVVGVSGAGGMLCAWLLPEPNDRET